MSKFWTPHHNPKNRILIIFPLFSWPKRFFAYFFQIEKGIPRFPPPKLLRYGSHRIVWDFGSVLRQHKNKNSLILTNRFKHRSRSAGCRHIDDTSRCSRFFHRLFDRFENGQIEMHLTGLVGWNTSNHFCAIFNRLLTVKRALKPYHRISSRDPKTEGLVPKGHAKFWIPQPQP